MSKWHPGMLVPAGQLTLQDVAAIKTSLTPAETLALTMWAEARSRLDPQVGWVQNPMPALIDVANVVVNRVHDARWAALGIKGVCLAPAQFSCWLAHAGADVNHDPAHLADNFEALMGRAQALKAGLVPSDRLVNCLVVAHDAVADKFDDELQGSCFYIAEWLKPWPKWAIGHTPVVAKYGHVFFNDIQ